MKILLADHVLPISAPPISKGAVAIDGGRIAAVGAAADIIEKYPVADREEFGAAAILPGFVNCHAHLELTALRGALDAVEHDFRRWLLTLNDLRAEMGDDGLERSAYLGAVECAQAGVTCIADIGRFGRAGLDALRRAGLRGVVYQETEFSPDNRTAGEDFKALAEKFEALHADSTELVRVGLSPHSPYTVGSSLFELIAQYAIINRIPLTIHAAESLSEMELLTRGTGFFTEVYERFQVEWQSPMCTPIEYLERLGVLSARPLLAHCVHASESDIRRIAANRAAVAHCPKSNAKFGHGYAPLEAMLDAGLAVGLGSDSVASNNVCDLLEEARFAAMSARSRAGSERFVTAREVLEAATLGGAKALGLGDQIGSLEVGKFADLAIIGLTAAAQQPVHDIEAALVFSSNARDVLKIFVRGEEVRPEPPSLF